MNMPSQYKKVKRFTGVYYSESNINMWCGRPDKSYWKGKLTPNDYFLLKTQRNILQPVHHQRRQLTPDTCPYP